MIYNRFSIALSCVVALSFCLSPAHSQETSTQSIAGKTSWATGLTLYSHKILKGDGVFPYDYSTRTGYIGYRVSIIRIKTHRKAMVYDFDIEFGSMQRYFYGHDYPSGLLGFQLFLGPRWQLKSYPVYFHSLVGFGFLWIMGGDPFEAGTQNIDFVCFPCSGIDRLRYEYYNSINTSSSHIPGFPSVTQLSFGANLGVSLDIRHPFRVVAEYLPLVGNGFHHDYRIAFVVVFK